MRVKNKGGVTPRDRRLDRRKVATAAALAAVLLFATQARAGTIDLQIDTNASTLGFVETLFDTGDPNTRIRLDNVSASGSYGQPNPSNQENAWGWIRMDWTPGTSIQFHAAGSQINYWQDGSHNSFAYFPYRDANGNLVSPPNGVPHLSQIGFEQYLSTDGGATFSEGFGYANLYNTYQTFGRPSTGAIDGGSSLPFVGANGYAASDNGLMALDGREDLFGLVVDSVDDLGTAGPGSTPFPSPFAGNVVTFDGTTLTIPLTYSLHFVDGSTDYTIETFGQIVATVVPEPSTMVMLGFGVVGLVGCFIRARKRRG